MELYLLQHGEATPKEVDPERPLTERGRAEVARVARAANYAGVAVATICHSGKLRASQTAEIVAREISTTKQPTSLDGIVNLSCYRRDFDDAQHRESLPLTPAMGIGLKGRSPLS